MYRKKGKTIKISFIVTVIIAVIIVASIKINILFNNKTKQNNQENNQESSQEESQEDTQEAKKETVIEEKKIEKEEYKMDEEALLKIDTSTRTSSDGKEYTSIGLLRIPSLDIEYQILSDTSDELLKKSITKYWGANPNQIGNMCILGHNYRDERFFGKLANIKIDSEVLVTDLKGVTLSYKVYDTGIITEDDLTCTSQKTDGKREITLITCYYQPGDKHASRRFFAKARSD